MFLRYKIKGKVVRTSFAEGIDPAKYLPATAEDVEVMDEAAVAEYEAEIKAAAAAAQGKVALQQKARTLIEKSVAETAALPDSDLVTLASLDVFDEWRAGTAYATGKRLMHGGRLYVVAAPVTAQEHQPPDAAGMLAVYRLIDPAAGTADDPKTLAVGMAVKLGMHYRYNGVVYRLARAMDLTVAGYMPGDPGMETFWIKV